MNEKIIELAGWYKKQTEWKEKVTRAEEALRNAQENLRISNDSVNIILKRRLEEGQSTGDALLDEALQIFGLDREVLEKLVTFNQRLIQNKGKAMLAVFSYSQRVRFGGPGDDRESDYVKCDGYIMGVLSGERLEVLRLSDNKWDGYKITIPFERHMIWGFRLGYNQEVLRPLAGKVILDGFSLATLGVPISRSFVKGIDGADEDVSIFIDGEIHDHISKNPLLGLKRLIDILHSATSEEQIVGDNI